MSKEKHCRDLYLDLRSVSIESNTDKTGMWGIISRYTTQKLELKIEKYLKKVVKEFSLILSMLPFGQEDINIKKYVIKIMGITPCKNYRSGVQPTFKL